MIASISPVESVPVVNDSQVVMNQGETRKKAEDEQEESEEQEQKSFRNCIREGLKEKDRGRRRRRERKKKRGFEPDYKQRDPLYKVRTSNKVQRGDHIQCRASTSSL